SLSSGWVRAGLVGAPRKITGTPIIGVVQIPVEDTAVLRRRGGPPRNAVVAAPEWKGLRIEVLTSVQDECALLRQSRWCRRDACGRRRRRSSRLGRYRCRGR